MDEVLRDNEMISDQVSPSIPLIFFIHHSSFIISLICHIFPTPQKTNSAMLEAIGAASIDELFAMVPAELRLNRDLCLLPALGEMELTAHMVRLSGQNLSAACVPCFLGGGSYDHFIPAAIDAIASRSEFYTSYTPYQAEAGQGNLQVAFRISNAHHAINRHGRVERQPVRRRLRLRSKRS